MLKYTQKQRTCICSSVGYLHAIDPYHVEPRYIRI